MTPSHETTARRIIHEIWRRRRGGEDNPLVVTACPEVAGWLRTIGSPGGTVYAEGDAKVKPGEYDISPADESRLYKTRI